MKESMNRIAHNVYSIRTKGSVIVFVKYNGYNLFADLAMELSTLLNDCTNVKKVHVYMDFDENMDYYKTIIDFIDTVFFSCDQMRTVMNRVYGRKVKMFIHYVSEHFEYGDIGIYTESLKEKSMKYDIPILPITANSNNYAFDKYLKLTVVPFMRDDDQMIHIGMWFRDESREIDNAEDILKSYVVYYPDKTLIQITCTEKDDQNND